ncbi:MAG TPA: hypothetical protein VEK33_19315 [Terriglobales bacterium]|nr:hypothetical protein [Terriglobales bacterium]
MKRLAMFVLLSLSLAAPAWVFAQSMENHGEVGVFADYLRFGPSNDTVNFVGVGGRLGINVHPNFQLEGEMNYDFERNYTYAYSNGITASLVTTGVRPLTGLFGPKMQAGTSGPIRVFLTGKLGFINFSETPRGVVSGTTFSSSVTGVGGPGTHLAFYPGGGIEGFIGPVGLRLEVGDEIYLDNGTYNNLRITFGPHIRF